MKAIALAVSGDPQPRPSQEIDIHLSRRMSGIAAMAAVLISVPLAGRTPC